MAKIIKNCLKQFNSNVTSYLILWRLPRDQKKKKNLRIFTKFYTSKISLKIFIDFLQRKFRNTVFFFFQFQLKMYRSPKAIKAYLTNSNLYTDCSGISWCCSFFPPHEILWQSKLWKMLFKFYFSTAHKVKRWKISFFSVYIKAFFFFGMFFLVHFVHLLFLFL